MKGATATEGPTELETAVGIGGTVATAGTGFGAGRGRRLRVSRLRVERTVLTLRMVGHGGRWENRDSIKLRLVVTSLVVEPEGRVLIVYKIRQRSSVFLVVWRLAQIVMFV